MRSISLVVFLITLVLASSKLSFKNSLKKSNSCSCEKTQGFGSSSWIKVYLLADTGKALARCNGCGSASYTDSAGVHGNIGDTFAQWKLYPGCEGKVVLQADTGKYLARCNGCWTSASYTDSAFVHAASTGDSWVQWLLINNGDGTYSFQSDTGNYLARCNGCVTGGAKSDFAFVHASDNSGAWVRWKIQLV